MPLTYDELKYSKAKRKRRGEDRSCPQCGKSFYVPPARVASGGYEYCSRSCYLDSTKVTKTCPVCNKEFTVNRGVADRYKVCSIECRTADTKYQTCKRCGKEFVAEKRLNRHYCSEECRRPPKMVICKSCGNKFRDTPSNGCQFCSVACYRAYRGETSLEAIVREMLDNSGIEYRQEVKVGRYSVDFILPGKIAVEADGAYWHQDKEKDKRRDRQLVKRGYTVIRLPESDILNNPMACKQKILSHYHQSQQG